jgi:hypothetical protein
MLLFRRASVCWLLSAFALLLFSTTPLPAGPTRNADRVVPNPHRADVDPIPSLAHVNGKYRHLLRVLDLPEDVTSYKQFTDWGMWNGTSWRHYDNLPPGHWVYVYPRWYIWRDCVKP